MHHAFRDPQSTALPSRCSQLIRFTYAAHAGSIPKEHELKEQDDFDSPAEKCRDNLNSMRREQTCRLDMLNEGVEHQTRVRQLANGGHVLLAQGSAHPSTCGKSQHAQQVVYRPSYWAMVPQIGFGNVPFFSISRVRTRICSQST